MEQTEIGKPITEIVEIVCLNFLKGKFLEREGGEIFKREKF